MSYFRIRFKLRGAMKADKGGLQIAVLACACENKFAQEYPVA